MQLSLTSAEQYDELEDDELRAYIIKVQSQLNDIPNKMNNDMDLQKALRVVASLRAEYNAERRKLKSVLETLNIVARGRSLL